MSMTIGAMMAETREINFAKGWRTTAYGPGDNTLGDYIALLYEEIGETVSAYRSWRLTDVTDTTRFNAAGLSKPEGVPSELADLLIRLLDMVDVFWPRHHLFDRDFQLADLPDLNPAACDPQLPELRTFADHMSWLARRIDRLWTAADEAPLALRALVTIARKYGVDLDAEYTRKTAYNRTRPFRHGGRALSDTNA